MKPKGYLTIITNNVFSEGKMYPLAFDTVSTLSKEPFAWTPKDEKVWWQDDKTLLPLEVFNASAGTRQHQYYPIFSNGVQAERGPYPAHTSEGANSPRYL